MNIQKGPAKMYPMSRAAKIKMLRKSRPINFSSKAFTLCNTNEENQLLAVKKFIRNLDLRPVL